MEIQTESRSLVPLRIGSRIPQVFGGFHLDDHNVEEWSDTTKPGLQHRARHENGKWINSERNADIQYQKREDNKKSSRGEENERTEVIEGKSPESIFKIIRTHHQFQDTDTGEKEESGGGSNSKTTSSSTSYQMSSSRGSRSTIKTTSNKTTSKTVTVSGGRADDFENLKISFQPLDNSTQRERINISRSGTTIRRPPTKLVRRHIPTIETQTENDNIDTTGNNVEDNSAIAGFGLGMEIQTNNNENSAGSLLILGYKNLSPKIRVGFPIEIQLELQTKLRGSSTTTMTTNGEIGGNSTATEEEDMRNRSETRLPSSMTNRTIFENLDLPADLEMNLEQKGRINDSNDSAIPLYSNNNITNNGESTFELNQRKKSLGFESFDSHIKQTEVKVAEPTQAPNPNLNPNLNSINNHFHINPSPNETLTNGLSSILTLAPGSLSSQSKPMTLTSVSRSWDLIQNLENSKANFQQRREAAGLMGRISLNESDGKNLIAPKIIIRNDEFDLYRNDDSDEEIQNEFTFDSLEDSSARKTLNKVNAQQLTAAPNVVDLENSPISPASERSRKLMKILDETPDLLNKMSFKNYFSSSNSSLKESFKEESNLNKKWKTDDCDEIDEDKVRENEGTDWQRQNRNLSFLSDSLNRILDSSSSTPLHETNRSRSQETNRLNTRITEFSENNLKTYHSEGELNGNGNTSEYDGLTKHDITGSHFLSVNDTDLDNENEVDYNSNSRRVSQTWIGDLDKPSQQVRDQDVITSISATYDSFRKLSKKVEFCKTEVHFTADSGKFHIVETDENKPSTVHLYRKKKRNERRDLLKNLDQDELVKKVSSEITHSDIESETNSEEKDLKPFQHYWAEESINQTSNFSGERATHHVESQNETEASEHLRIIESLQNELATPIKAVQSQSPHSKYEITNGDELNKSFGKNGRLMMNLNLNLALDVGDFDGNDDDIRSPSHTILSKYGELKIQRYLKQLTSPSLSVSETSETSMDNINQLEDLADEDPDLMRFDNNVLYENGSFVPMATRKSLIEMNNRNRKRGSQTTASQTSEKSSTGSNYSLPNSENNPKNDRKPLKLTAMEATVRTIGPKPQITSVQLRYSVNNKEDRDLEYDNGYQPQPYMTEPIIVPQLSRETHQEERGKAFQRHIPFAVMPPELSSPPYRNGNYSFSPSRSPSKSPTRDNAAFRNPKPPTPVLPIQFSTFEKSGAALRERFYSKNPSCCCHSSEGQSYSTLPTNTTGLLGDNSQINTNRYSNINRTNRNIPSKSIVTIGIHDQLDYGDHVMQNNAEFPDRQAVSSILLKTHESNQENETRSAGSTPEPILSMDHTWKGPAHFENSSNPKGTSLTRSMTFPKSTRPEPEWVSKAKSREARVTDWNLVGRPYGSNRKSEPPWISEIRHKNKTSSTEEIKSLPKISIVYPWQRESSDKNSSERIAQSEHETPGGEPLISATLKKRNEKEILQNDKQHASWKLGPSDLSSIGYSKSIVDMNRDSDSILINPPQIEVKTCEPTSKLRISKNKHYSTDTSNFTNIATTRHNRVNGTTSKDYLSHDSTNQISTTVVKTSNTPENSWEESLSSNRKPLQASTITNKNQTNKSSGYSGQSSKPPLKPPQPPQRTSSLLKTQATLNLNSSLEKKHSSQRRIIHHSQQSTDNSEDSPGSSRSNTPIHRHPTVKITKLPLRSSPNAPSTEEKTSSSRLNKIKTHVSLLSEAKRMCNKSKQTDSSVLSSTNKNGSPIQNQNQSPITEGKATGWSNSIKKSFERKAPSISPTNKKMI